MKAITHRDQIHGDVRYDPLSAALLNTSTLQRLGRIYQLGYAHLVYRGGTHTRLSHVMGAAHVAGELVDFLRQNYLESKDLPPGALPPAEFLPTGRPRITDDQRWDVLRHLVRWAALLHDVGHIPLGHTLEDEFDGVYVKHDDFASPRIPHLWHEIAPLQDAEIRQVFRRDELLPESFRAAGITGEQAWQSVMLICLHKEGSKDGRKLSFKERVESGNESEIPFLRILKNAFAQTDGKTFFPYMADIVGNTICADYLDYLRRDPSNVGLDVLRDDRVASRFFVGKDSKGLLRMALALVDRRGKPRLDTCTGVVELVRQRFRFAEIIYYHKTKVAASAMLARAFSLIGKPEEVGSGAAPIDIEDIPNLAADVASNGVERVGTLYKKHFPSTLLDPEIGDETLLLWLQERAWKSLDEAAKKKDQAKAARLLRGISMLQALVRRRLYKVCFSIDCKAYGELSPGSKEESEVERRIQKTLADVRTNEQLRTEVEAKMASAAGWPEDALLLYVPPRKSQAKGIETGALDRGDVVTLGSHSAVRDEVAQLNEAYKKLWRIILLVNPRYQKDVIGLSKAVDQLVLSLWPSIEISSQQQAITEAAWFHYIPEKQRLAAARYQSLIAPDDPDWVGFDAAAARTTDGTISTEEHAERAILLSLVSAQGGTTEVIRQQFGVPNSLSQRLLELEPQMTLEGRDGVKPEDIKMAALERIARELHLSAQGETKPLFKKER